MAHATAVAAIVLRGKPQIREPLQGAWWRALHAFDVPREMNWNVREAGPWLYRPVIGQDDPISKLQQIFAKAPVWLLAYTFVQLDADRLGFACRT